MNECQGTLSESSWVTTMMLDTSRGHPRFHKSGHGGSVDVFLTLPSTKKKKKKKKGFFNGTIPRSQTQEGTSSLNVDENVNWYIFLEIKYFSFIQKFTAHIY